jgi:peptidoglycan/LPS O-acetylase OafA/YrhL
MKKTLIYLGISVTLAFVFAIAYVIIMTMTLPKTDLAYGQRPFQDPFVFPIMALVAGVSGLVGWPLFAFLGRHSRPATVATITGVTTLLFILVATPLQPGFGFFGSYMVCLGALVYCYLRHRPAGQQSASPNGAPATRLGDSGVTEGPPSVS